MKFRFLSLKFLSFKRAITLSMSAFSIAVLSLLGVGPIPSFVGQAQAASCIYIDNVATQAEIGGNGVNHPVTIVPNGNCFYITHSGSYDGYTWHMYQNNVGHCLWSNGPTLDVGAACANDNNHPNEEFFTTSGNGNSGYTWSNVTVFEMGGGSGWAPSSCSVNSEVTDTVYSTCGLWLFPSP